VTYADNSYVIVSDVDEDELIRKANGLLAKHVEWLTWNGMVCNIAKTEVLYMGSHDEQI